MSEKPTTLIEYHREHPDPACDAVIRRTLDETSICGDVLKGVTFIEGKKPGARTATSIEAMKRR